MTFTPLYLLATALRVCINQTFLARSLSTVPFPGSQTRNINRLDGNPSRGQRWTRCVALCETNTIIRYESNIQRCGNVSPWHSWCAIITWCESDARGPAAPDAAAQLGRHERIVINDDLPAVSSGFSRGHRVCVSLCVCAIQRTQPSDSLAFVANADSDSAIRGGAWERLCRRKLRRNGHYWKWR